MWEAPVEWIDAERYKTLSPADQQNVQSIVEEYSIKWLLWLCSTKVQKLLQSWVVSQDYTETFEWLLD